MGSQMRCHQGDCFRKTIFLSIASFYSFERKEAESKQWQQRSEHMCTVQMPVIAGDEPAGTRNPEPYLNLLCRWKWLSCWSCYVLPLVSALSGNWVRSRVVRTLDRPHDMGCGCSNYFFNSATCLPQKTYFVRRNRLLKLKTNKIFKGRNVLIV